MRESDFRHDSTLFDTFHRDAILPYNEKRVYKGFTSRTWRPWGQIRENDYMARTVLIVEDSDTTADTLDKIDAHSLAVVGHLFVESLPELERKFR